MPALSATPDCCWSASAPRGDFPRLTGHSECDVVVVGAGIVGLSAAMTLCEAGKSVVVLEAREVGGQVTGRSTAKVTTQHALIYRYLIDTFGQELAQCYADANREAVARIRHWVTEHAIDCDYERQSAYAYACSADWRPAIDDEAEAARRLGFAARVIDQPPLPFATAGALEFPDQAQFNPTRYLIGLANSLHARGGRIHQHTRATSFERQGRWRVGFDGGTVEADQVILATHMPVETPVDLVSPTQPRCHVAMAFRPQDGAHLDGMFIGVDEPTHSIRMGRDDQGRCSSCSVRASGPARTQTSPGGSSNSNTGHAATCQWVRPSGAGATRITTPPTGSPMPASRTRNNPRPVRGHRFQRLGYQQRHRRRAGHGPPDHHRPLPVEAALRPQPSLPDDFNQSSDSQTRVDDLDAIGPGEGGVITRGDEQIAVWRDDAGTLHAVSAACTHMGCSVTWNNADRTWDCPCHGSIFQADGEVIHGPAIEPLAARSL